MGARTAITLLSGLGVFGMATACSISVGTMPAAVSVTIAPSSSSIGVGYHQAYSLTVRDAGGKPLPDATGVLSISPDGSCTARVCTASAVGLHVVTATYGGRSAVSYLNVTPGGFHSLGILPHFPMIIAGSPFAFTAVHLNSSGDPISDVTASATFAVSNEGSCAANVCTFHIAHGGQVLTITEAGHVANVVLQVSAGTMTKISLEPNQATVAAGSSQIYTATGYDDYGNMVENEFGATNFAAATKAHLTITPDGSCARAACTPLHPGVHTITITYSGQIGAAALTAV